MTIILKPSLTKGGIVFRRVFHLLLLSMLLCGLFASEVISSTVRLVQVVDQLQNPWALDFLPAQPLFPRVPHDLLLKFNYAVQ